MSKMQSNSDCSDPWEQCNNAFRFRQESIAFSGFLILSYSTRSCRTWLGLYAGAQTWTLCLRTQPRPCGVLLSLWSFFSLPVHHAKRTFVSGLIVVTASGGNHKIQANNYLTRWCRLTPCTHPHLLLCVCPPLTVITSAPGLPQVKTPEGESSPASCQPNLDVSHKFISQKEFSTSLCQSS